MLFNIAEKHDFTPIMKKDDKLLELVEEYKSLGVRWLFEFLKADSIHLSSRSLLVVIYPKMMGTQDQQIILSYWP